MLVEIPAAMLHLCHAGIGLGMKSGQLTAVCHITRTCMQHAPSVICRCLETAGSSFAMLQYNTNDTVLAI